MEIYSPDDCYVEEVFVYFGKVTKGENLIQLVSPALDDRISEHLITLKHEEIKLKEYEDGRNADKRQAQIDNLSQLKAHDEDSIAIVSMIATGVKVGSSDGTDLKNNQANEMGLKPSILQQQLVVDQFDQTSADSVEKIKLSIQRANDRINLLTTVKRSLLIIAPTDGDFECRCLPNMFYQQGEIIGLIFSPFEKRHGHQDKLTSIKKFYVYIFT